MHFYSCSGSFSYPRCFPPTRAVSNGQLPSALLRGTLYLWFIKVRQNLDHASHRDALHQFGNLWDSHRRSASRSSPTFVSSETDGRPWLVVHVFTAFYELPILLQHIFYVHTLFSIHNYTPVNRRWNSIGGDTLNHRNPNTERNSHLVCASIFSSIGNGCWAKSENWAPSVARSEVGPASSPSQRY